VLNFLARWKRDQRSHDAAGRLEMSVASRGPANETIAAAAREQAAGRALLEQGRSLEALSILRNAAEMAPAADIFNDIGLALKSLNQWEEAAAAFDRALELRADHMPALANQAAIYVELGRFEDAKDACHLMLAHDQDSVAARWHLGTIGWRQGDLEGARRLFQWVVERDPAHAAAHIALGTMLFDAKRYDEALVSFDSASRHLPPSVDLYVNQGLALQHLKRLDEAIARQEMALALQPDHLAANFNLANALLEQRKLDAAIARYRRVVSLAPDYIEAWNNLGNALRAQEAFDKAEACYRTALNVLPAHDGISNNLAYVLSHQARYEEASGILEKGLVADPSNARARTNLGILRLIRGDFAGWSDYEWRFLQQQEAGPVISRRHYPYPEWQGESLAGKRILIWGEQGIGDELSCATLYGEVIAAADRCVIECAPKLVTLFARSFPGAEIIPRTDPPHGAALLNFDYQIAAGSLGRWLRNSLEDFPRARVHLTADAARAQHWRTRIGALGPGLKVGFGWRSSNMKGERAFYCTRIDQWGPIFAVKGAHFVNLQYDECQKELAEAVTAFNVPLHVFPEVDLFNDVDEASALSSALDLVITAPTAVGLISSAVGVETWQMSYGPDWQMHGTADNPWHRSLKLYRRPWNVRWESVIGRVATDLTAVVARRSPG
jgi:tetratricopeptide (TPR) repeat protein